MDWLHALLYPGNIVTVSGLVEAPAIVSGPAPALSPSLRRPSLPDSDAGTNKNGAE